MFVLTNQRGRRALFQKRENTWYVLAHKYRDTSWIQYNDPPIEIRPTTLERATTDLQITSNAFEYRRITEAEASMILFGAE